LHFFTSRLCAGACTEPAEVWLTFFRSEAEKKRLFILYKELKTFYECLNKKESCQSELVEDGFRKKPHCLKSQMLEKPFSAILF
jgi:hypothetical protein